MSLLQKIWEACATSTSSATGTPCTTGRARGGASSARVARTSHKAVIKVVADPNPDAGRGARDGGRVVPFRWQWLQPLGESGYTSDARPRPAAEIRRREEDGDGGFGAANCSWGTEQAARSAKNATLVAFEAGVPLYRPLVFEAVKNMTIEMLDGLGPVWYGVWPFG
ncbi:hypothetical protein DL767_002245 [Monosporascus sp. MG133]|nr:hypothetical protein DL767_002245 [Monosporascus sp. MG133]